MKNRLIKQIKIMSNRFVALVSDDENDNESSRVIRNVKTVSQKRKINNSKSKETKELKNNISVGDINRTKEIIQKMIGGYSFSTPICDFVYTLNHLFTHYIKPELCRKFIVCADHNENNIYGKIFALRIRVNRSSLCKSEYKTIYITALDDIKESKSFDIIQYAEYQHSTAVKEIAVLNEQLSKISSNKCNTSESYLKGLLKTKIGKIRSFTNTYINNIILSLNFFDRYSCAKKVLTSQFKNRIIFKSIDEIIDEMKITNLPITEDVNSSIEENYSVNEKVNEPDDSSDKVIYDVNNIDDILSVIHRRDWLIKFFECDEI